MDARKDRKHKPKKTSGHGVSRDSGDDICLLAFPAPCRLAAESVEVRNEMLLVARLLN
jgi:hypothetical protein